MLTLYYTPHSRATRVLWLIEQMGLRDRIDLQLVTVRRQDGSGGHDPANPHPEGKVPLLVHDGEPIRETSAIMLYLTDLFPQGDMGPGVGEALRGRYLSLLAYYGNVMEPVLLHDFVKVDHPALHGAFRGPAEMADVLSQALGQGDWLLGDKVSAADLLLVSPFLWIPDATPDDPSVHAWVSRCKALPSYARAEAFDAEAAALRSGAA